MKSALNEMLASQRVPADLSIIYDDMHGLWGGSTYTVQGDGSIEWQVRPRGAPAPTTSEKRISERELLALVRLLVELSAWEQRTADRPPVPDESRAYLTITLDGKLSRMWEWYNDMRANGRLIQVKGWLEGQFSDGPSGVLSA
jgi:hypothetical protein